MYATGGEGATPRLFRENAAAKALDPELHGALDDVVADAVADRKSGDR